MSLSLFGLGKRLPFPLGLPLSGLHTSTFFGLFGSFGLSGLSGLFGGLIKTKYPHWKLSRPL